MAGAALAAQQGDPGAQFPVLVEVDAVLLVEGHVDHAVVGGDVQRGARRQLLGEPLDQPVDVHQPAAPGVGVDAEAVAGAVDLGVVRVDQGAVARGQLRAARSMRSSPVDRPWNVPPLSATLVSGVLSKVGAETWAACTPARSASWKTVGYGCQAPGAVHGCQRNWFISSPVAGLRTV
ncbi:hypothetical protein SALBM311S_10202 [Streptomyces alboniger]